jgi:tetratricopeptide (TPR) repeat protein
LEIARETGDRAGEGRSLGKLGDINCALGYYDLAIEYHQQHLKIAHEINEKRDQGNALSGLGKSFAQANLYKESSTSLKAALEIFRELKVRQNEAEVLLNLVNLYRKTNETELAFYFCSQAIEIANSLGLSPLTNECEIAMKSLADSSERGDYQDGENLASNVSQLQTRALELQGAVNQQVETEITELKAISQPIYYSRNGKLIRENADGQKYEYRPLPDGTEELLAEIAD